MEWISEVGPLLFRILLVSCEVVIRLQQRVTLHRGSRKGRAAQKRLHRPKNAYPRGKRTLEKSRETVPGHPLSEESGLHRNKMSLSIC
jgi:hypothetical protein